jgi:hypothetical protein
MDVETITNYMKYHEIQFIETPENFIVAPNTSLQQEYLEQWTKDNGFLKFDKSTGKNAVGTRNYILVINKLLF